MKEKEIVLRHVKILFAEIVDKGYGKSITIDATEPTVKSEIEEWANANGINAKFKEYTNKDGVTTLQYQFKFSKFIKIAGKDASWNETNLGYGAVVNLFAESYEYDNKFGKGKTASVSNIYIVEPMTNTKMSELAE